MEGGRAQSENSFDSSPAGLVVGRLGEEVAGDLFGVERGPVSVWA